MGLGTKLFDAQSEVMRKTANSPEVSHFLTLADAGRRGGASGGQRRALKILGVLPQLIENMCGLDTEATHAVLRLLAAGATKFPSLREDISQIIEFYEYKGDEK